MGIKEIVEKLKSGQAAGSSLFDLADKHSLLDKESHQPFTSFCNTLRFEAPELLESARIAAVGEIKKYLERKADGSRRILDMLDLFTCLRDVGDYNSAQWLKQHEGELVAYVLLSWDVGYLDGQSCQEILTQGSKRKFIFQRLEVMATAMAYRPMPTAERINTLYNIRRLADDCDYPALSLPVHAAYIGSYNRAESMNPSAPIPFWARCMGRVAAVLEVFYWDYKSTLSPLEYWVTLVRMTGVNGNYVVSPHARYWYNEYTKNPGGIDWIPFKEHYPGFRKEHEEVLTIVTKHNRTREYNPGSLPHGDLFMRDLGGSACPSSL